MNVLAWLTCLAAAGAKPLGPEKTEALYHITAGGWAVMFFSVGIVTVMTVWCIYKVVAAPKTQQHLHAQPDIESPDRRQP